MLILLLFKYLYAFVRSLLHLPFAMCRTEGDLGNPEDGKWTLDFPKTLDIGSLGPG